MRNSTGYSGVNICMLRSALIVACSIVAFAQPGPPKDPFQTEFEAFVQAQGANRFEDAAAHREKLSAMLSEIPADLPAYAGRVLQVAQHYQGDNLNARARTILQDGLDRANRLGETHPSRIALLSALSEAWGQDGNLLKAAGYLEQAAAAQAAAAKSLPSDALKSGRVAQPADRAVFAYSGRAGRFFNGFAYPVTGPEVQLYLRLADLYQQLGRPVAAAGALEKIRALGPSNDSALAQFYERTGRLEDAAAVYQRLAEQTADPQAGVGAWQSLANLQARQERYTDAAAALQHAVVSLQSSDKPEIRSQATWMTGALAGYLRQAGQLEQADRIHQQLFDQSRGAPQEAQVLFMHARYLGETERGAQAEKLLQDYLAGHPGLSPVERMGVLNQLVQAARSMGDLQRAEEYQKSLHALQPRQPQPPAGQTSIQEDINRTRAAVAEKRWDDAYNLALVVLAAAPHAADGQQIEYFVPEVASALASIKETEKAEKLFQALFLAAQDWATRSGRILITASEHYVDFLSNQPDRWNEVPAALGRFRDILAAANGADSGTLVRPLRKRVEFAASHADWQNPDAPARELLELQESLSGNTSAPYLDDLLTAARAFQAAGDSARALPLFRTGIRVADLTNDPWRRIRTRIDTALGLAQEGEFDEAEKLAGEAAALERLSTQKQAGAETTLEQVRKLRRQAAVR